MREANGHFIVIEDSEIDFMILERAFSEIKSPLDIVHCDCGDDFFEHVEAEKDQYFSEDKNVFFVCIDLNMPGIDGHQILQKARDMEQFQSVPLIVLSSSNNPDDVSLAYKNGANSYIQKPETYEQYLDLAGALIKYWTRFNINPTKNNEYFLDTKVWTSKVC